MNEHIGDQCPGLGTRYQGLGTESQLHQIPAITFTEIVLQPLYEKDCDVGEDKHSHNRVITLQHHHQSNDDQYYDDY